MNLRKKALPLLAGLCLLVPTTAFAGIRTGIGIGFPAGTARSVVVDSYASVAFESIVEEMTVRENDGALHVEFKISNASVNPVEMEHNDGKLYEITVLDKKGVPLYSSSYGMEYRKESTIQTIGAHSSATYSTVVPKDVYKKIRKNAVLVTAKLDDTPYLLATRVPTHASVSRPTLYGSIILGNGNWEDD